MYTTKKLIVPRPQFFVLYNGAALFPDRMTLRLSDSFTDASGLELEADEKPALDLAVQAININEGRNEGIAGRCKTLAEYAVFVAKVWEFGEGGGGLRLRFGTV
jgi:hypothetical protein